MQNENTERYVPRSGRRGTGRSFSKSGKKSASAGMQVLAVQSIACVGVVLLVLLLRVVGGSVFTQLRDSFNQTMQNNAVASVLAAWFGDKPGQSATTTGSGTTTTAPSGGAATETTGLPGAASVSLPSGSANKAAAAATATMAGATKQTAGAATGGAVVPMKEKRVLYAPENATFGRLPVNRLAYLPLEQGTITSYFGYREDETGEIRFHMGLDIGAPANTPISAMYYGVVTEQGTSASYGNYVRLNHGGGVEVLYAHCTKVLVEKGTVLRAGETVAAVGSTGDSTGNHLHVEVHLNGIAYDPANVIPLQAYA